MIRDARGYLALQAIGLLASLFLLIIWLVSPPTHPLFPLWFLIGVAAFLSASFAYKIVMTLRGRPIPRASWARNVSDKQLWTVKGILMGALVVAAAVIIFRR